MPKKKPEKSLEQMLEEALVKEDEQPYEVPGNWEWTRPTSLTEQLRGVTYKKKDAGGQPEEGKSLILRAGNLQEGEFITDHDCVYVANDLISNIQQLTVGDVVVVGSSGSKSIVGKAAQVKKVMPSTSFGAFLTLFRPNNLINSKYYGWFFQSKYYRDTISMLSAGININNIKLEHFESLHFPLPPLPEQKRIVKKLSSMLGKLKEAKELIQEARDTFEERRAAILNKAFTGDLTKKWRQENPDVESAEKGELQETPYNLPKSWSWVRLEALFHEVKEKVVPSLEINCAYIGLENLKTGGGLADIGKSNKVKSLKTVFRSGDVLYGKLRPYLNKHTKVDFDGITSTDILVFRTKGVLSEELLDMFFGMPRVVDYANRNSKGINLPRVSPKVMMRLLIPVPPPDEQKEIVRILDKLLDHEDEAKVLIDMEEQIDLLEKSILSKAFRGELGTNDTNDEPAIELLKRSLKEKMNK